MFIEATTAVGARVTGAIREAARVTGAGFDYLLKTALRESNFDPAAKASTSSATGLFQFIDQTWLATLKESGPAHGYGRYADAIVRSPSGSYSVPDAAARREIMGLRTDPTANAVMAGAFTNRNAADLASGLGRKPTEGELYMAHFLGSGGAVKLIRSASRTPLGKAANLFPEAASANPAIFYDKQGKARSLEQVYGVLAAKMDAPAGLPAAIAAAPVTGAAPVPAPRPAASPLAVAAVGEATPASPRAMSYVDDPTPIFQGLFRTGREPLAPVVSELWGPRATVTEVRSAAPAAATTTATAIAPASGAAATRQAQAGAPLDLFQFLRPEIAAQHRRG
jgi:hypothetical protein